MVEKKNQRKKISREELVTGFTQIFGSKIQDFFQNFFQTITSFSRLTVIKQVINRDLKT